ncbi:MAG: DNA mismatch repair endonuclease MutH, partial [Gammaproteobacteria bacterium]|nr:DNA mismatch repair endonuclease MutH [Gammaproteobacteria bacterium]
SLGATASSLPEPDFQHIGVELKTLPLNKNGTPKESTYVCAINLTRIESQWEESLVKRKLSRVLWLPIEADPDIPLAARRIGSAILWSPDEEQEATLRRDWEELMDMIATGELEQITAHQGQYLQVRPKAANTKALRNGINDEGEEILTLPRGFYLRTSFTRQIL